MTVGTVSFIGDRKYGQWVQRRAHLIEFVAEDLLKNNMAWIHTISPAEATGRLKKIYDQAIERAGRVFNILRIQSLNPAVLEASVNLYSAAMHGPSSLTRTQREMLATVTSWANDCFY